MSDLHPDCTCYAPDDAEPEDHDEDCPEHPRAEETLMAAETLTPEQEIAAARMDVQCTGSVLANVVYWMRVLAGVPQSASVWYAYAFLWRRAMKGDPTAVRKLAEFDEAATAYEGARVALADLTI